MTKRVFHTAIAPSYPRGRAEENCSHDPEAHVVYDNLAAGYRGQIRCSCGKIEITSKRLHETCAAAEAVAAAMRAVALAAKAPRKMRKRKEKLIATAEAEGR